MPRVVTLCLSATPVIGIVSTITLSNRVTVISVNRLRRVTLSLILVIRARVRALTCTLSYVVVANSGTRLTLCFIYKGRIVKSASPRLTGLNRLDVTLVNGRHDDYRVAYVELVGRLKLWTLEP